MVVDNADDANVLFHSTPHNQVTNSSDLSSVEPLADFLPQKSIGSILVTSRNRDVAYRLTGNQTNIVEVKPMNHQDAFALLQKKLGCNLKRNDAIALTDALGSMPLALTQAASFIKQRAPRMSISRYVKDIHKNDHNRAFLLSKDVGDSRRDGQASNSIITTWHMSFEYIRSRTPAAARLLSLMSFFDRQSIPASLLESSYGRDERPEADFEDDIYTLTSFSLAEWSADGKSLKMHGLVQFCTKRWLELHNEHEHWKEVFLSLIDTTWSEDASENWPTCQALFPHAQAALDNLPVEADALEVWASVAFKVAEYVGEMGDFHKSCKLHRDAFEVREILLGAEHAATLRCLNSLGIALGRLGRYDEAVATHQRDLEASERTLGANDINTLMSMINLASAYKNQGESIESERILKQVLETAHKTELGADHTLVRRLKLNCFTTLALTYRSQGLWERAEELQLQVLEAREEELGKDDPTTRKIRGDLALTYAEQGRLKDAEELRLEILESNKRNPGPETEILVTRSHLAEIYKKQGRWDEAEQLRLQVMERSKILVGLDHPGTILSMSTLASLYWEQGRFKEAEELQLQTLELRKANLGEDHPATLINKNNLSATYWSQGIFDKHEKLEAEILESNLAKLGEFHPNTLRNKAELVFTYKRHGRMEDAQRLVEHVWQARTEVLGPEHPDTLCTMSNLCYTWKQRGFTEKAVPLFEKCCEAYERVLGAEHPDTVRLKARLVEWQSEGVQGQEQDDGS
jgi:tetratricopeptide (TPR) repeat protein